MVEGKKIFTRNPRRRVDDRIKPRSLPNRTLLAEGPPETKGLWTGRASRISFVLERWYERQADAFRKPPAFQATSVARFCKGLS